MKIRLNDLRTYSKSLTMLVFANSIPLIGTLFWDWSIYNVLGMYLIEVCVVGFFNIARISKSEISDLESEEAKKINTFISNKFGLMNSGLIFTGKTTKDLWPNKSFFFVLPKIDTPQDYYKYVSDNMRFLPVFIGLYSLALFILLCVFLITSMPTETDYYFGFWLSSFGLFLSHWVSYRLNYIGREEYKRTSIQSLFWQPYRRLTFSLSVLAIVPLIQLFFHLPMISVIIFILLKILFDVGTHIREHEQNTGFDNSAVRDSI